MKHKLDLFVEETTFFKLYSTQAHGYTAVARPSTYGGKSFMEFGQHTNVRDNNIVPLDYKGFVPHKIQIGPIKNRTAMHLTQSHGWLHRI